MAILKNIEAETVLSLDSLVTAAPGQIVSRTLVQNRSVSMTLFAFSQGEEISTHASVGDAMATVLEGTGQFTVDGTNYLCSAGETLIMPAGKPHSVFAPEAFKMLLTVVFPIVKRQP